MLCAAIGIVNPPRASWKSVEIRANPWRFEKRSGLHEFHRSEITLCAILKA
jgi:hypothetical protein